MVAAQIEALQLLGHGGQPGIDIYRRLRHRWHHPNQAKPFPCGQFNQAQLAALYPFETRGLGNAAQLAIQAIGPGMIGAAKGARMPTFLALNPRPAVAAHVQKRAQGAIVIACHQNRHAGGIMGEKIARLRHIAGMAHNDWKLAKQHIDLARNLRGVGVAGDGVFHHLGQHMGGFPFGHIQDLLDNLLFFSRDAHRPHPYNLPITAPR